MDVVVKDVIVVFNTPDANNQAATTRSNPKKLILKLTTKCSGFNFKENLQIWLKLHQKKL